MSLSTTLEYWNEAPGPDEIHVILHSRKKFYNGKAITWYEFAIDGIQLHELGHEDILPKGFLRVDGTDYYEFGGTKEAAINTLTTANFTLIVESDDL